METNGKWYIRGKKGCAEQVKRELIKRGAKYNVNAYDVSTGRSDFEDENLLFTVVEGVIVSFPRYMYYTRDLNWQEIKIDKPKPKPQFKPFDRVLACDGEDCYWGIDLYDRYDETVENYPHVCLALRKRYCIPYEGNENLVGVMFDPKHIEGYDE